MPDSGSPPREPAETVELPRDSSGREVEPAGGAAPDPSLPSTWDRYQVVGLLGEGGMGRVFRAYDPVLRRPVAVKVLHAGSSELLARFLAEARAQARVSHPNVAKVFDVGMTGDRPFIAMQLVEGKPLGDVAPSLPPRALALLMQSVAEGVGAANRLGLVHRDLKPGNVLVEERPDGSLHPYVVDFGLARDLAADGQTVSGHTVGTPSFMAPEQAGGDAGEVGPRTDVYGLGATLYAALAGRPPFRGSSAVEVMVQVVEKDPEPLRSVAPGVPADLATLVGKCMEKEPRRRYARAEDLARDLGRFLAGEPIEARAPTLAYRLRLRVLKNRLVVAVAAAGVLALAVLGGYHLREGIRLRRQAELAREFGQVVERIEARLRQAYLLPPHDVRPARRRVEEEIRALESRRQQLGDVALPPGAYAIGRALLALGRNEPAIARLREAFDAGYRPDETAYALAVACARRYEEEIAALASVRNPVLREARRRDAQARYRDPAVTWLKAARRTGPVEAAYAEALLAFLEKRRDVAVRRAREAYEAAEGFYEAKLLEAEVEADQATEEAHGGSFEAARASLDRAEVPARLAARIGESDPATYETLCGIESTRLLAALYSSTGDVEAGRARAVSACREALRVDPDSARALRRLGTVHRLAAEARLRKAQDPGDLLDEALAVSRRAVALEPHDPTGLALLGAVWQVRGRREANSGGDPRPSFTEAVKALEGATALRPALEAAHNSLGVTWWYRAQWEIAHGVDPRPSLDAAARSLSRSTALLPAYAFAWVNLGGVLNDRGAYELSRGLDPSATLLEASAAFAKAMAIAGEMPDAWNNSGVTWLYAADHARLTGRDPREAVGKALAAFEKAAALNPGLFAARINRAQALRYDASWKVGQGLDPEPGLSETKKLLEALSAEETFRNEALIELAADPRLAHAHRGLADAALVEARWLSGQGRPATGALDLARREIEAAAALDAGHVELTLLRRDLAAIVGAPSP